MTEADIGRAIREALNLGDVKQFTFEYRGSRYLEDTR
jgi:hypothetical protein